MNNSVLKRMLPIALVAAAFGSMFDEGPTFKKPYIPKVRNPWDDEHLSKNDRRGKTHEELQAMRKEQWQKKQIIST
jgi:hypothetical protein